MVEDQALQTRARIHDATANAADLYGMSADDLRFDVAFLDATLRAGRRYAETLGELLQTAPAQLSSARRPVEFTQARAPAASTAEGALTVRVEKARERAAEVDPGRHRR